MWLHALSGGTLVISVGTAAFCGRLSFDWLKEKTGDAYCVNVMLAATQC